MSKLYHVSIRTARGVTTTDAIASNTAVAIKRAMNDKALRTAREVSITCTLSNHGEYDKACFDLYNENDGPVWAPKDKDGRYYRVPGHIRRAQAEERLGIEAQRILDNCPAVMAVRAKSRGLDIIVERREFRSTR